MPFSRRWKVALSEAQRIVDALPVAHVGECVLGPKAELYRGDAAALREAVAEGAVFFHAGSIGGALPRVTPGPE